MKTITLASFFLLLLNSCASKKEMNRTIEFTITDKSIADHSFITLEISNKTALNYYLPALVSFESDKLEFILPLQENNFFCMYKIFTNSTGKKLEWLSNNCFAESIIDEELETLHELWKQKKKNIGTKDLILLKSGESIRIKIPINLNLKITKECSWEIENYRNEKELKVVINYVKKDRELATKFLSSETLDSLKEMGYELYDKEIISNKVPLIIEK